jgi:hypothetical protein
VIIRLNAEEMMSILEEGWVLNGLERKLVEGSYVVSSL